MDRQRQYTPTRNSKINNLASTVSQSYLRSNLNSENLGHISKMSQLSMMKDYEAMKIQVRQLESQNRSLSGQIDRLTQQRAIADNKYLQKLNYQQETLNQFQKQKSYQMELQQLKHDEETNRIRRECENQVQDLMRQIKNRDYQVREKAEQIDYLQLKNGQLNKQLNGLQKELIRSRDQNSEVSQLLTKEQFASKKLQMLADQLQRHKEQMQEEIHVLLDIEAEKSKNINYLEAQLRNSQNNEKSLNDKLVLLTDNFAALEDHIAIMKQKLISADSTNRALEDRLDTAEILLREKENALVDQAELQISLRKKLQEAEGRQRRRQRQVDQLAQQNERLYKELNNTKMKLHDICVGYGIDI